MDLLVKRNVIKKNKLIIDMGRKYTKILSVHYEKGRVTIHSKCQLDTAACYLDNGQLDFSNIVRRIDTALSENHISKKYEISLSLPSQIVVQKVVTVKNIRPKELDKYIRKEYATLGRANAVSHEISWSYLGSREISGETVQYCMIAAVSKAQLLPLLQEFDKRKLKVTTVSCPVNNLAQLSALFENDYTHPNKMLLDFGASETRLVIASGGMTVYVRTIEICFETFVKSLFNAFGGTIGIPDIIDILLDKTPYLGELHDKEAFYAVVEKLRIDFQNELIRVIRMCDEEGISITKIICCSPVLKELIDSFEGIEVEYFQLNPDETAAGNNYIVHPPEDGLENGYCSALGLAVGTLQ